MGKSPHVSDWDDHRVKQQKQPPRARLFKRVAMATTLLLFGSLISSSLRFFMSKSKGSSPPSGSPTVSSSVLANLDSLGETAGPASIQGTVTDTVRKLLGEGMVERLSTTDQREEWKDGLLSLVTGTGSCDAICSASGDKTCARDWFAHIDNCQVAKAAFGMDACSAPGAGQVTPVRAQSVLLVSKNSKNPPSCQQKPYNGGDVRLCPCVPKGRARKGMPAGERSVKEVALKYLTLKIAESTAKQVNSSSLGTDPQAALHAQLVHDDISFYKGDEGQSCETVCKGNELVCNADWFSTLNRCEFLKAMWPKMKSGSYFKDCNEKYYGFDLPAYQGDRDELLINNDMKGFTTQCSQAGSSTQRICPCKYRYPKGVTTYHTVFSVQSKQYFEWQSRYLQFWHKQVQQPGKITRLLSMGGAWPSDPNPHPFGDHLMKEINTHVVPEYDASVDYYTAYNKPLSIAHWLQHTPVTEDVIIVLDPDCAFVKKAEYVVEEGSPIANQGYYSFKEKNGFEVEILKHYCRGICKHFDPIAVPVIIHRNDLARIAPLWLKYTEDIRRDREGPNKWPIQWNDNKWVVNRIEWVAEMFGYVLAAAHLDLRHEIVDLQMVPGSHKKLRDDVPFLHYHVTVEAGDKSTWGKQMGNAHEASPWPVPKGTDEVTASLLKALHDARQAVGQTERTKHNLWGNNHNIWRNPDNKTDSDFAIV